jgi:hypothetical protein
LGAAGFSIVNQKITKLQKKITAFVSKKLANCGVKT